MNMRPLASLIQSNTITAYLAKEAIQGNLTQPVGTDYLPLVQLPTINQKMKYSDVVQMRQSLTTEAKVRDSIELGSVSGLSFSAFPSGAAGVAGQDTTILEMVYGKKIINAATSIEYALNTVRPTATLYVVMDDMTVVCCRGFIIEKMNTSVKKQGEFKFMTDGKFAQWGFGISTPCKTAVNDAATEILFDSIYNVIDRYYAGLKIMAFDSNGNALLTAAVEIQTVDTANNKIILKNALATVGGIAIPLGTMICPYLPTPSAVGNVVEQFDAEGYMGLANAAYGTGAGQIFDPANKLAIKEMTYNVEYTIGNPSQAVLGQLYPKADWTNQARKISGQIKLGLTHDDVARFGQLLRQPNYSIAAKLGRSAGSIIEIVNYNVVAEVPDMGDTEGAREITIPYTAVRSTLGLEKESAIIYR